MASKDSEGFFRVIWGAGPIYSILFLKLTGILYCSLQNIQEEGRRLLK